MHCLELNLAKVAWKHSFGNRMLPHHRERVAENLNKFGCPLDIRKKGKGDNQQKWFSASTVDNYLCGADRSEKSASPGLTKNTWAICERVFDLQLPVAARYAQQSQGAQPAAAKPASHTPRHRPGASARRKRSAPESGFVDP
eukprot:4750424-Pleurochrysis_carterae.AAC.1